MLKNRILSGVSAVAIASVMILTSNASGQCEPAWSALGIGVSGGGASSQVKAMAVFDDSSGAGPQLHAGGSFAAAGAVDANGIAKWDGDVWLPLGSGVSGGLSADVRALTVFDDGSGAGPALYAGGNFTTAGGVSANYIAKWDGAAWSPLGSGMNNMVQALTVFDDGSGGGPALYAGGGFTTAGGVSASSIAKWDGAAWSALGSGVDDWVGALTVFDDGSAGGPALYAGGWFETAGGLSASRIARWDGNEWTPLGSGVAVGRGTSEPWVGALTVFDDGSGGGPALYAGGPFAMAGGVTVNGIAKWDGDIWAPLGSGLSLRIGPGLTVGIANSLTAFDDGSGAGAALYAGGNFDGAGGEKAFGIAKWDGAGWSEPGDGLSGGARSLMAFDDGSGRGPALYVGGGFAKAGGTIFEPAGIEVNGIARWGCDAAPCYADCDRSGGLDFFDFLCFQNEFAAGAAYADCDESGSRDFFDFLCFQNEFAAGCP